MLIEEHIIRLTNQEGCARIASKILSRTPHLIKARSVAVGAAQCIFRARLVEAFGVSGFFRSIIPGKGNLVHQILAIAFPKAFLDIQDADEIPPLSRYIDEAYSLLESVGMISDPSLNLIDTSKREAETMLRYALEEIPEISRRIGLHFENARVYTEMQLMSYKIHIWGVLDALIEDHINQRAIVIDWKTGEADKASQVTDPDLAQVCAYALLEADRLGFEDLRLPVIQGKIVPIIVRPRGKIPVSSISPVYQTLSRKIEIKEVLDKIILAAEHLTLIMSNVRKHAGKTFDRICRYRTSRGRASAFTRTPDGLPRGNPNNNRFPCKICPLVDECLFYIATFEDPTELDRLAWRSRYATYSIRENALTPYKEIHDNIGLYSFDAESFEQGELFTLECGSRIDLFKDAEVLEDSILVKRPIREKEEREDRIITLREGRPVALFFHEPHVLSPVLRLSFIGRVDEVIDEDDEVWVTVGAPNIPSRLQSILFRFYIEKWRELSGEIIAVETNVDLTQMELRAIDAFQRGTKRRMTKRSKFGNDLERLKQEALDVLFGTLPSFWRGK